jgi:plastocyanin
LRGRQKIGIIAACSVLLFGSMVFYPNASAESLPLWIKNTALWYGEGSISETEFLNAIKFIIENDLIELEEDEVVSENLISSVLIPNGNFDLANTGFYIPLNLEVVAGTTVEWINDDSVPHTIQSQDEQGKIIGLFNSAPLMTGEKFEYVFDESGVYNYYCSLHPWRVGLITVR